MDAGRRDRVEVSGQVGLSTVPPALSFCLPYLPPSLSVSVSLSCPAFLSPAPRCPQTLGSLAGRLRVNTEWSTVTGLLDARCCHGDATRYRLDDSQSRGRPNVDDFSTVKGARFTESVYENLRHEMVITPPSSGVSVL
jgi:hypothetical protein